MNDVDYDAMQKKRVAASARKRKGGSKSRKCSLPHDNMTEAQWKKMNGEIKSWNLDEPMTYEQFKGMEPGLKKEYIRGLNSRFNAGVNTIGVDLFGLSKTALAAHLLKTHGIRMGFSRGMKMTAADRAAWERWLGREADDHVGETNKMVEESAEKAQPEPAPPVDACEETEAPAFGMDHLTVEWRGVFSAKDFIYQLCKLPLPDGEVKIHLEVSKVWTS